MLTHLVSQSGVTAHWPLPTAHCPLASAHCPLPSAHCPLPTAHCPLPTAHCPLPCASYLLLTLSLSDFFSYISTLKTEAAGPTEELQHLEGTF
jgi:hypothetical protein